jgi:energy-coupling factor transporter ATP-binding protein EcfA2
MLNHNTELDGYDFISTVEPLRSVEISGLRGFSTPQIFSLAAPTGRTGSGLSIITGPNNSGKSTIIEALRSYNFRYGSPSFHQGMRNRTLNNISIKFNYDNLQHTIESIRPGSSETIANFGAGTKTIYCIPSRRHFSPYFGKHSQIWGRQEFLMITGDQNSQQQRQPTIPQFEMRLFDIDRNADKRQAFNEIVAKVIIGGVDWSLDQSETSQYLLRFSNANKAHSAEGVGEGITSIFAIVAGLYDSTPGDIIVIDEPELSLHPSYQKRLIKVLSDFAKDRQIVISTHSPYMIDVNAILNGGNICRVWERSHGSEIHSIDQAARSSLSKLAAPNRNNPHQFGFDARETFFLDDGIIVTEGQEDVVLLPVVFDQAGGAPAVEYFGWGAGGASNIEYVCSLLSSLGYEKVVGVLDNDKPLDLQNLKDSFGKFLFVALPAPDIRTKPPRKAVAEKIGLLDTSNVLRSDLTDPTREMLEKIKRYLAGTTHNIDDQMS